MSVQEIRDASEYPGLRLKVPATIGNGRATVIWDVTTGDPVVPPPREVTLQRLIGEPVSMVGYAPEATVAEKGVTIIERGITSTRWRDYVDIVVLGAAGLDARVLAESARAVAAYRGVVLQPVAPLLAGYGAVSQAKWAAWVRKEGIETLCAAQLDEQIARVAAILDPVFTPDVPAPAQLRNRSPLGLE